MSTAFVLLVTMFGQVASAEDVVSQMQAQDDQIQTLEFLFHLEQVRGPGYFDDEKKIEKTETRGRLLYRAPQEVRLERLDESGEILEVRVTTDGTQAKGFTVRPETGLVDGFIMNAEAGGFYTSSFTGVNWFFRHAQVVDYLFVFRYGKGEQWQWQVSSVRNLLRLTRPGFERDVDPARGYWMVAERGKVPYAKGDILRTVFTEPVEFSPGIWIAKSGVYEQKRHGKVFMRTAGVVDLDSVKINQPLASNAFDIVFPAGTRVDNLIQNTSEFIGGQNSRDRKSVEKLAAANIATPPVPPSNDELAPRSSTLRVPESSFWNGSSLLIVVACLLVLTGSWVGWHRWNRS